MSKKTHLLNPGKLIMAILLLAVAALLVTACLESTATLSGLEMCEEPVNRDCPEDRNEYFSSDNPKIYVTGIVTDVPKTGALVTATWFYLEDGEPEELISFTAPTAEEGVRFEVFIEEDEQWRLGRYEVVLSTGFEGESQEAARLEFFIR